MSDYYELRLYRCHHGRIPDMVQRMTRDVLPLFEKNGIGRPLIHFTSPAGPRAPLYGYILRWDDLDRRMQAFRSFYADPDWHAQRALSNAGSQMVDRMDISILRPEGAIGNFEGTDGLFPGLLELRLQDVMPRDATAAIAAWTGTDLPFLTSRGAILFGTFSTWFGARLPQIVSLLAWPDIGTRQRSIDAWNKDDAIAATRLAERKRFGRPIFERADIHLMNREI